MVRLVVAAARVLALVLELVLELARLAPQERQVSQVLTLAELVQAFALVLALVPGQLARLQERPCLSEVILARLVQVLGPQRRLVLQVLPALGMLERLALLPLPHHRGHRERFERHLRYRPVI